MAAHGEGTLSFCVRGSDGFFKAVCPELQIAGTGESIHEAKESLMESARLTAKYIMASPGGTVGDAQRAYAKLVLSHWDEPLTVFIERQLPARAGRPAPVSPVYARPECPFEYCDAPAKCAHTQACRHRSGETLITCGEKYRIAQDGVCLSCGRRHRGGAVAGAS